MPQVARLRRPKVFPPPEFPPRRPRLFARTPPAIFPAILGLLGLGLALRLGLAKAGLPGGIAEMVLGATLGLWAFAVLALGSKILRRPEVVMADLATLPGRAGFSTAVMSLMLVAAVLIPYSAAVSLWLVWIALILQTVVAGLILVAIAQGPAEQRVVTPVWHLSFVGFIVAAVPAAQMGQVGLAGWILGLTLPVAVTIWLVSAVQLWRRIPPPPLRPLLAVHLSPAALFCTVLALLGYPLAASGFAIVGAMLLIALTAALRWITVAGFTPFWGSFTFPLAAYATALLTLGGGVRPLGYAVLLAALAVVPLIVWRVLRLWPGGTLAAKTNAAEA